MSAAKYQAALNLAQELGANDLKVEEANGVLKVWANVGTEYDKDTIWDKIKEIGGASPSDIVADFRPTNTEYYGKYTVVKGDTLGKISKTFYGEPGKYKKIFEANRDQLSNPDLIEIGQELVIPFAD